MPCLVNLFSSKIEVFVFISCRIEEKISGIEQKTRENSRFCRIKLSFKTDFYFVFLIFKNWHERCEKFNRKNDF